MSLIDIYLSLSKRQGLGVTPSPMPSYHFPADGNVSNKVLVAGDSISASYGLSQMSDGWDKQLCTNLGWINDNEAVSGNTITANSCLNHSGLEYVPTQTAQYKLFFIAFGTNDARTDDSVITAAQYQAAIESWVNLWVSRGGNAARVIVLAPYYNNFFAPACGGQIATVNRKMQFVNAALQAATNTGAFGIDLWHPMEDNGADAFLQSDLLHPNLDGHTFIANYLTPIFS